MVERQKAVFRFALRFENASAPDVDWRDASFEQRRTYHQKPVTMQGIYFGAHQSKLLLTRKFNDALHTSNEIARLAPHTAKYCGGRVNCVCPGWTRVPRTSRELTDTALVRKIAATMALPQIARPDDIANAVIFLSSDTLARHITGQTLVIAGGMEGRLLWHPEEIDSKIV